MNVKANTQQGTIEGEQKRGFVQFLGIPYAKPPIGELRFRKPQKLDPWTGTKRTTAFGAYCCQPGKVDKIDKDIQPSENCLTLNVFTPACDGKKRPVVIWIHGGAYLTGNACTQVKLGGNLCIDSDIVVVTIQYRLGAFGCMDFSTLSGARGRFDTNCGTWDQVAAVNWVIENIASFGGDSENIGLMGDSAGGCSVLTLITTPYLKGKIKRAVLESPAPHLMHTRENARLAALDVISYLGIKEEEAYQIADMPAEQLVDATIASVNNYVNHHPFLIATAPVVDGDLIPELPYDAVMHGAANGISVLLGTTRDEGSIFALKGKADLFPTKPGQLDIFFQKNSNINKSKILALYPDYPDLQSFREIGKEVFFHLPTLELADHLAVHASVYLYHFEYAAPVLRLLKIGAAHCANSVLTSGEFKSPLNWFSGKKGKSVMAKVHSHWGNFLSTGNPNDTGYNEWPVYGNNQDTYFINVESHSEQRPFEREREAYGSVRIYGN